MDNEDGCNPSREGDMNVCLGGPRNLALPLIELYRLRLGLHSFVSVRYSDVVTLTATCSHRTGSLSKQVNNIETLRISAEIICLHKHM